MSLQVEIIIIAVLVALCCSIMGCFIVVRRMAMMTDGISHGILLGIVLAFLISYNLDSPLQLIGAACSGVFLVILVETLNKTGLVAKDTAIGLCFPLFFSIGVILITFYAQNIHLDIDAVILGELAFAPFHRFELAGIDLGPRSLVTMAVIFIIICIFVTVFYKELLLSSFDSVYASLQGFRPKTIHYMLMVLLSIVCVGAFEAAGTILVVALIVTPASCSRLLTHSLKYMIILSQIIALTTSIAGFYTAYYLDVNIASTIVVINGICFFVIYLLTELRKKRAFYRFSQHKPQVKERIKTLLIYIEECEQQKNYNVKCDKKNLITHFRWDQPEEIFFQTLYNKFIFSIDGTYKITNKGRKYIHQR